MFKKLDIHYVFKSLILQNNHELLPQQDDYSLNRKLSKESEMCVTL